MRVSGSFKLVLELGFFENLRAPLGFRAEECRFRVCWGFGFKVWGLRAYGFRTLRDTIRVREGSCKGFAERILYGYHRAPFRVPLRFRVSGSFKGFRVRVPLKGHGGSLKGTMLCFKDLD